MDSFAAALGGRHGAEVLLGSTGGALAFPTGQSGRPLHGLTFDAPVTIELQVDPSSSAVGKTLADIGLPKTAIVAGVIRNGATVIPRGQTIIKTGDRVVAVSLPEAVPTVEKTFA